MSESFELREADHFTAGAIGPAGQRVFYLQAANSDQCVTLKVEKQQVVALCEHLAAMMSDLPEVAPDLDRSPALRSPLSGAWVVGGIGVAYEQEGDRILIVAEELEGLEDGPAEGEGASARLFVPRRLIPAFVAHGLAVAAAGRPTCDLCGGPVDPAGHACPRLN